MHAKEQNFGFMANKGTIKILFFQRAYVWKEENWVKLWNDLLDSYNCNYTHFLGSVILKSNGTSSSLLIDGQQRATTFSLLLKVIGEQLDILDKDANLIHCLFGQDDDYHKIPRIEHSRLDKEAFQAVILGTPIKSTSLVYQCYEFFQKKVIDLSDTQLKGFLKRLLTDKLFVVVEIDSNEDEQRIFDSINTSGQILSNFDIVKNELFSHYKSSEESEKIFTKLWIPVFEKDEETKEFWDEGVLTGRETNSRADVFLHNFAIIEGIFDPTKDSTQKMNEVYKKYISNLSDSELLNNLIQKFTDYASIFKSLPFSHDEENYEYNDSMKRFLHITHVLQLSTLTPIALFLELSKMKQKISQEDFIGALDILEKYVIRRALLKLDTSGYNKTIYTLITTLSKTKSILQTLEQKLKEFTADTDRFPLIEEIDRMPFENFDTKLAKLLLFWLELKGRYNSDGKSDATGSLQYNFQLEHIMPKAWEQYWKLPSIDKTPDDLDKEIKKCFNIDKSIYDMSDYEFIDCVNKLGLNGEVINSAWIDRNRHVWMLGNYTILSGRLNNSLKNYEWARKLDGEGSKKGIKYYSSISFNRELCEYKDWTEDAIVTRTDKLKKKIIETW